MYKRIVVQLDGSETAESILPFAERLGGPAGGELMLVRVVEPISSGEMIAAAGVVVADTYDQRLLEAKQYLLAVEGRLSAKGLRVRAALRSGAPAPEILAAVAAWGADLIAMATHGRGGLGRLFFGSVAEAVLRGSTVPVLMIRTAEGAPAPGSEARP